jgi:hypothetical protein
MVVVVLLVGCGADSENLIASGAVPDAGKIEGGSGGSGGLTVGVETCDGLDNDGDGKVDDGCACVIGATHECYPDAKPPAEGCAWGVQTCTTGDFGLEDCVGASFPPDGEAACCNVLGATPEHALHDAFVAAYPASAMPKDHDAVNAFEPVVNGHKMAFSNPNPGNEICDENAGGVSVACVDQGRAASRQKAEASLPVGTVIVDVKEEPVVLEGAGCNGVGWGWGSLLVQTENLSVSEVVYLYIGFCIGGKDTEHFYYSQQPLEVCKPPIVPR